MKGIFVLLMAVALFSGCAASRQPGISGGGAKTRLVVKNGTAGDLEIHVGHWSDRKQSRSKDLREHRIRKHDEGIIVLEQGHEHELRLMYWAGGQRFNREWRYRAFRGVERDTVQIGGYQEGFFQNRTSQLALVMPSSGAMSDPRRNRIFAQQDSTWVKTHFSSDEIERIISFYSVSVRHGAYLLYPGEHFMASADSPQKASFPVYFGLRVVMVNVDIDIIPDDTPFNQSWYDWGGYINPEAEVRAVYARWGQW